MIRYFIIFFYNNRFIIIELILNTFFKIKIKKLIINIIKYRVYWRIFLTKLIVLISVSEILSIATERERERKRENRGNASAVHQRQYASFRTSALNMD